MGMQKFYIILKILLFYAINPAFQKYQLILMKY
jgi:hypothetical protein